MKTIKVLGSGCTNCKTTLKLIEEIAGAKGVDIRLEKVEEIGEIMGYGVMSTPGVVIDGKVMGKWCMPAACRIAGWSKRGSRSRENRIPVPSQGPGSSCES